jgi:hypothetical protein
MIIIKKQNLSKEQGEAITQPQFAAEKECRNCFTQRQRDRRDRRETARDIPECEAYNCVASLPRTREREREGRKKIASCVKDRSST